MSRASRVPYHQNAYDLLLIEPRPLDGVEAPIRKWEQRTGHKFPPALAELYTTEAVIPCGVDGRERWALPLTDVWFEYSNGEPPVKLDHVLDHYDRPERVTGGVEPGPYFLIQVENQGCWLLYAHANGDDDPPVLATDGGPHILRDPDDLLEAEWLDVGSFTEVLFRWFAWYYHDLEAEVGTSFVPLRFMSHDAEPDTQHLAPPKPYANGLWLRSRDEPFQPPVIDFLTDRFGEPERTPRPGGVTTYTFRPQGGMIRVTADEPALTGGLSAWWVHADTAERLAEFARLLLPWGTLRETLRADTDHARDVLKQTRG
jgi:hypothetical protein